MLENEKKEKNNILETLVKEQNNIIKSIANNENIENRINPSNLIYLKEITRNILEDKPRNSEELCKILDMDVIKLFKHNQFTKT